jgi:hypothetical protein
MSRSVNIVTGNSLTQTLNNLCTYLSTAFVDKFSGTHLNEFEKKFPQRMRNAECFRTATKPETPTHSTAPKRRRAMRQFHRSATRRDVVAHAIALAENALPIYSYAG